MSIWSISSCGFGYRLRNKDIYSETCQFILVLRNEGYSMQQIAKKLKISYNPVYYSLHRTAQAGSNQNRKRSGRPRCTSEQEEYLTPSVKHGGGNVMVWGCFGGGKVGDLYRVKGILKKEG